MSNPFKVGDRVEVLPKPYDGIQYHGGWVSTMRDHVGKTAIVSRLDADKGVYLDMLGGFTYDVRYLKLVSRATGTCTPKIKPTTEATPDGLDQHAPGAKLDAGKLRPALVLDGFANALLAVVKVGTDGAAKYTDNGWREVTNGFKRYSDAEGRHRLYRAAGETHDKLSGSLHLAHEAWNALAKLELYLMENPE